MKTATMLAVVFLFAIGAASQTAMRSPTQAQCKFSDGSTIRVTYSPQHRQFRFSTDGSLLTANGENVPSGDYSVYTEEHPDHQWSFMMKSMTGKGYMLFLSFPMSMVKSALSSENPKVSFDQTGGSCVMHLQEKPDTLLSLEFTKRGLERASLR